MKSKLNEHFKYDCAYDLRKIPGMGYVYVQINTYGQIDYTIYARNMKELDGGIFEMTGEKTNMDFLESSMIVYGSAYKNIRYFKDIIKVISKARWEKLEYGE